MSKFIFLIHFDQHDKHSYLPLNPLYLDPSPNLFYFISLMSLNFLLGYIFMLSCKCLVLFLGPSTSTLIHLTLSFPSNFFFLKKFHTIDFNNNFPYSRVMSLLVWAWASFSLSNEVEQGVVLSSSTITRD